MSLDELLKCLKKSRLLTEKQLALVQQSIRASKKQLTPEAVTDRLVKQELITEWQAKMLLQKQTGFVLGKYRLLKPIGQGGMGKVFKAWDRKKKQVVAIKVLSKKLAKNKKLVARFQREIDVASKLDSPHIVRTVDAGTIGQSHFMVMEYVEGESIDAIANRHGRISAGHACELARQAALGLQAAHDAGMVHRDIKPGNLMMSFTSGKLDVKLLDMGLARLDEQENDGMTKTGQVMGTPDYMAPEQGWNTADVDIRADIYSLGCSLFRLVTGGVPFPGDNPLQILMARCSTDAPLASSLVPDLDPRIDAVIRGMTWRDPGKRFQTPAQVAEALADLAEVPVAADFEGGSGTSSPASQVTMAQGSTAGPPEPSFKEFLRDMDSGAKVELMTGTTEGFESASGSSVRMSDTKPPAPRNKKALLLTSAVAGIVGLAAAGFSISGNGDAGPDTKPEAGQNAGAQAVQPPPGAVEYFAQIPAQRAEPGQVVSFYVTPEFTDGLDDVRYLLGTEPPAGATLDAETGEFYWVPPRGQKSGRLTVRLLAKRGDKVESERDVFIDILAAQLLAKIVEFENTEIVAGAPWKYQIQLFGQNASDAASVKFQLVGNPPEGLKLDAETGELTWTPTMSQTGRHPLNLQLLDPTDNHVVHSASCSVVVGSAVGSATTIVIGAQSVVAGTELRINLTREAQVRLPPRAQWVLSSPVDVGAAVDPDTDEFTWTPAAGAPGKTVFEFTVSVGQRSGKATLEVTVTSPSDVTEMSPSETAKPSDAEVAEARAQIRDIFKRDFAQRSANAQRELASKLLVRAFDDNSPAMNSALLELGFEVAKDSKAYATGSEIVQLMESQFGIDSVTQTAKLISDFKSRGVSNMDKVVLIEVMFREALNGAKRNRFESVAAFVRVGGLVAKSGPYKEPFKNARSLLKSLPTDSDDNETLDEKQQVAKQELIALLTRFQFTNVFRSPDSLTWIQNEQGDPGSGEALWAIKGSRILMESPQSALTTGFIDSTVGSDSTVIRLQVAADSTTGMLILGTPNSGRLSGYQIPLAGSEMLSLRQSNLPQPIARPQTRLLRDKSGWDLVEVAISGESVRIGLNGTPVTEGKLPEAALGSTGLFATLQGSQTEHKLHIRNVRVMQTATQ